MTASVELSPTRENFARLSEPHRAGLRRYCYRMLGGLLDADDLVQETYLRAWRSLDAFRGGSFRGWLYAIATRACLDEIARRKSKRRWLPDQLDPLREGEHGPSPETRWLEPFPETHEIADEAMGPEARYAARESVRLAFVAAIQQLSPRQRAALLLCDVLGWPAAQAAETLDASLASLNSLLQRARKEMAGRYSSPIEQGAPTAAQRALLTRYVQAWENHDIDALVATLKADARCVMPPWRLWLPNRAAIAAFFVQAWGGCPGLRLTPLAANGQHGFAAYQRRPDGHFAANALHVLTLDGAEIETLSLFLDEEARLFEAFGLPRQMAPHDGSDG